MNAITRPEQAALQNGHDHEDVNTSGNESIHEVVNARLSRRGFLGAGVGTAGTAVLGSMALVACGGSDDAAPAAPPAPGGPSVPAEVPGRCAERSSGLHRDGHVRAGRPAHRRHARLRQ
jgi:hypothetical protein